MNCVGIGPLASLVIDRGMMRKADRGKLKDHLQRAQAGAFTQTSEVAPRTGADRAQRVRVARSEASEAAAALEAVGGRGLAYPAEVDTVIELLWRQSAMLYRLAHSKR